MRPPLLVVFAVALATLVTVPGVQATQMSHSVVGSGGATASAPGLLLSATVGEGAIGPGTAPGRTLGAGFWLTMGAFESPIAVVGPPPPPLAFRFHGAMPNPIRGTAAIGFDLPQARRVSLAIYSISGSLVRTLVDRPYPAGSHVASWDGRDRSGRRVANGNFLIRIVAGPDVDVRKLTVLR